MRRDRTAEKFAAYESQLEELWDLWLGLGRPPDKSEVGDILSLTEGFGSIGKALRFLKAHKGKERGQDEVAAELAQTFLQNWQALLGTRRKMGSVNERQHRFSLELLNRFLENIGETDLIFTTVEFKNSANDPLPIAGSS